MGGNADSDLQPGLHDDVPAEVLAIVSSVTLADATGLGPEARLRQDLGVESIDLLEILFGLEERFGIDLGPPPVFLDSGFFDEEAGFVLDGQLTSRGREALASLGRLPAGRLESADVVAYLGTIQALADLVSSHLSGRAAAGRSG